MRPQLDLDRVIRHMKDNNIRPRYVALPSTDGLVHPPWGATFDVMDRGIWLNSMTVEATFTTYAAARDCAWRLSAEQYIADAFIDQLG